MCTYKKDDAGISSLGSAMSGDSPPGFFENPAIYFFQQDIGSMSLDYCKKVATFVDLFP
jgi:hypothetical protein